MREIGERVEVLGQKVGFPPHSANYSVDRRKRQKLTSASPQLLKYKRDFLSLSQPLDEVSPLLILGNTSPALAVSSLSRNLAAKSRTSTSTETKGNRSYYSASGGKRMECGKTFSTPRDAETSKAIST